MSSGRRNKLAGQIGEFLVCAELGRRGLIATPFSGNVPTFDVLATDEQCRTVPIQVKASRSDRWHGNVMQWMQIAYEPSTGKQIYSGPLELATPDLIWIFVVIAPPGGQDRFFICTGANVQKVCVRSYTEWMEPYGWKRPRNPASTHCAWGVSDIEQFEDNWDLILARFHAAVPDPSLK
jgi:hypothetical protein